MKPIILYSILYFKLYSMKLTDFGRLKLGIVAIIWPYNAKSLPGFKGCDSTWLLFTLDSCRLESLDFPLSEPMSMYGKIH